MIAGFPGETDADFEELVEFVSAQRFERLGVFTYSLEPDTPAAKLPDHVPPEVMQERRERLMAVQQEIAFTWNEAQIGRRREVLIDAAVPGEKLAFPRCVPEQRAHSTSVRSARRCREWSSCGRFDGRR